MSTPTPPPSDADLDRLIGQLQSEDSAAQRAAVASEQSLLDYIRSVFAVDSPQKQSLLEYLAQTGPALLQVVQRALGI